MHHFEDVLGFVPNFNRWGDTSLPRYFQLMGIGEMEQYQVAPKPSVGFIIDDIDYSGLGRVGTLYDLDPIDVLRGAQATRYGAGPLASLTCRAVRTEIFSGLRVMMFQWRINKWVAGIRTRLGNSSNGMNHDGERLASDSHPPPSAINTAT